MQWQRALAIALWATVTWFQPGPAVLHSQEIPVVGVQSVGLTVADMDRSLSFYTGLLGFEKRSDVEIAGDEYAHLEGVFGARCRVVRLQLGEEFLVLTEFLSPRGKPIPADSRSNDRWFQHIAIVTADMERAYTRLRSARVQAISTAPQRLPDWNRAAAGIRAFYFRDPDGHPLELITFPAGKGDSRWQRPDGPLFRGIDHTAIAVDDTEASLGFYRDRLGMRVAGESENYGSEQEHLNQVFAARLRITGLRASQGPGIELLEYLTPGDGRPYPPDAHANDLIHWQTTLVAPALDPLAERLRLARTRRISPGTITLPTSALGFRRALLIRDPDGHALQLVEP